MPRYKTNEKDENQKDIYQDICNPITKEFREQLYGDILTAFVTRNEKGKAKGKEETEADPRTEGSICNRKQRSKRKKKRRKWWRRNGG